MHDRTNSWNIYLKDLQKGKRYKIKSKNLILALGAGKTPIALRNLGLKHNQLGKFEIHPSARISCHFPNHKNSESIVEPFQITGHFPYVLQLQEMAYQSQHTPIGIIIMILIFLKFRIFTLWLPVIRKDQ